MTKTETIPDHLSDERLREQLNAIDELTEIGVRLLEYGRALETHIEISDQRLRKFFDL
jgi:hypothetical protein